MSDSPAHPDQIHNYLQAGRVIEDTLNIRYKGQPIRDIVYLSEKLRDMTLWKLVFLDEIRDSWEHDEAASEMQGHLYSYFTRTPGPGVSLRE